MASWKEVAADASDFALRVEQALTRNKHMTMEVVERDWRGNRSTRGRRASARP